MKKIRTKIRLSIRRAKRLLHKFHNRILTSITWIAGIVFLASASAVDSDSWIPFIMYCISGAWISLFVYANYGRTVKRHVHG